MRSCLTGSQILLYSLIILWIHADPYVRTYFSLHLVLRRICSFAFSKILYSNGNLESGKSDRKAFSRKILLCPRMGKKALNCAQNRVFASFHKFLWLSFVWNNLKWNTVQLSVFYFSSSYSGKFCFISSWSSISLKGMHEYL